MRCGKHPLEDHCRLKAEATGTTPGQWMCTKCTAVIPRLIEHGHIEFADGRKTSPYRPIPRNTREVILRCIGAAKRKAKSASMAASTTSSKAKKTPAKELVKAETPIPKLVVPEHSETKGSSSVSRSPQISSSTPKRETVKASAPARKTKAKTKKKAPEPPPMDSLF
jgi:hypothetical protein